MKRALLWIIATFVTVMLLLAAGAFLYARSAAAPPDLVALDALKSDTHIEVLDGDWITFTPRISSPTTGLIFYPGGFVDPRAYAPVARRIAAEGYRVVIPTMPLNLAVLNPNRAAAVAAAHPEITHWAVAGHSLGGVMAAQYAAKNSELVDALILWAAYPPASVDLSGLDLVTTSIYGTQDGLVSQTEIDNSKDRLPPATRFVPIEGGNHAQFGSYGPQKGDLPALISAEEQQEQVANATADTLASIAQ